MKLSQQSIYLITSPNFKGRRPSWNRQAGNSVGSIVGVNPYETPYEAYRRLRQLGPPKPQNDAMRRGKELGPYMSQVFEEAHRKRTVVLANNPLTRRGWWVADPKNPFFGLAPKELLVRRETGHITGGVSYYSTEEKSYEKTWKEQIPFQHIAKALVGGGLLGGLPWAISLTIYSVQQNGKKDVVIPRSMINYALPFDRELYEKIHEQTVSWWREHMMEDAPPDKKYATNQELVDELLAYGNRIKRVEELPLVQGD